MRLPALLVVLLSSCLVDRPLSRPEAASKAPSPEAGRALAEQERARQEQAARAAAAVREEHARIERQAAEREARRPAIELLGLSAFDCALQRVRASAVAQLDTQKRIQEVSGTADLNVLHDWGRMLVLVDDQRKWTAAQFATRSATATACEEPNVAAASSCLRIWSERGDTGARAAREGCASGEPDEMLTALFALLYPSKAGTR
jgi:uncharacterized membrane protein